MVVLAGSEGFPHKVQELLVLVSAWILLQQQQQPWMGQSPAQMLVYRMRVQQRQHMCNCQQCKQTHHHAAAEPTAAADDTGGCCSSARCAVCDSSLRSPLRQQHATLSSCEAPVLHDLFHRCAQLCGRLADGHTSSLQGSDLVGRLALAARDDGTRVAHAATRRRGQTCAQTHVWSNTQTVGRQQSEGSQHEGPLADRRSNTRCQACRCSGGMLLVTAGGRDCTTCL